MDEIRSRIERKWAALSKNDSNFKFVDRSGKAWEMGRYTQMLARTTATRVYNDSYLDRMAENGFRFVRISQLGAEPDCDVCRAWKDVICVVAGKSDKYPTYEEARAAGVFHPNCLCTLEYVDELGDKEEIERQGAAGKVDWSDPEAVERRKGGSSTISASGNPATGNSEGERLAGAYRSKTEHITNLRNDAALATALEKAAERIRGEKVEHMVVLNPDGTQRFDEFVSTTYGGPIPPQWHGKLKGATLVHNHPGLGDGLSDKDIFTARSEGLRTIQAISLKADYTLTVAEWPSREEVLAAWTAADAEVTEELAHSRLGTAERMLAVQDLVTRRFAERLGLSYNKVVR